MSARADASALDQVLPASEVEPQQLPPPCGEVVTGEVIPLSTRDFACMAMDTFPGVGQVAPSLLLGPWADALDPGRPMERRAWLAAVGAAAFTLAPDQERSPFRAWCRDDPRPVAALRQRAIVVFRTPWMAWRLRWRGAWEVEPLLPVGPQWVPSGPVDLEEAGGVDGGPAEGGLLLARVVPTPAGWRAVLPLVLPEVPSQGWWEALWGRVVYAAREDHPELRREDVLRRGGHHLVREAHLWSWFRRTANTGRAEPRAGG